MTGTSQENMAHKARHWMRKTEDRGTCHALGEAYVQQWTVVG